MLELQNVKKTFFAGTANEKKALRGVSYTLDDGDFCTVIGSNGAGKSTTLNAIAGVFPIDSGSIKIDGVEINARFAELVKMLGLGLETRMTAHVGLLSGGQRQALTLLMATLVRPKLLLLDEHTAALDPKTAAKVLEITERLVTEQKLTTLMITHNMRDALRYGNRLIMMHDGRPILDVRGEEKAKLTTVDLLKFFEKAGDGVSDKMLLAS